MSCENSALCSNDVHDDINIIMKHIHNTNLDNIIRIVEKYQSQPQLLDPYLYNITQIIFNYSQMIQHKQYMHLLYTLCKVRGYKIIGRYFPHQVHSIEPVVSMLIKNHMHWKRTYCFTVWLSELVLLPFDLESIDTQGQGSLSHSIIHFAKEQLIRHSAHRSSVSLMTARLLTRKDMNGKPLTEMILWANSILLEENDPQSTQGALEVLCDILKITHRDLLRSKLDFLRQTLETILSTTFSCYKSCYVQKMVMKLVQRLCIVLLPVSSQQKQPSPWAMPTRILFQRESEDSLLEEQPENYDIDSLLLYLSEIESSIGCLLQGITSRDIIVRWSAAKGISRICDKLPRVLATDVILAVISRIELSQNVGSTGEARHGSLLSLAELFRRALVPPDMLTMLSPEIINGLQFDSASSEVKRICPSVRDAACFVCWSIARAYRPNLLDSECLRNLAFALINAALFDREINVRRAACAAFQEFIGRFGSDFLPDGILLNTLIDFFTVASLSHTYLEIPLKVSCLSECYFPSIVEHLSTKKLFHWDPSIQDLSSKSLSILVKHDTGYFEKHVIPGLLHYLISGTEQERHGTCRGIRLVGEALFEADYRINDVLEKKLASILDSYFKFKSVEWDKCCILLTAAGYLGVSISQEAQSRYCNFLIDVISAGLTESINFCILEDTIWSFSNFYDQDLCNRLLNIEDSVILCCCFGSLSSGSICGENSNEILNRLRFLSLESPDPDIRCSATRALVEVSVKENICVGSTIDTMLEIIHSDYQIDDRGDIGSTVRKTAIIGLERIVKRCTESIELVTAERITSALLKQCIERIDSVRWTAGETLNTLLQHQSEIRFHSELCGLSEICESYRSSSKTIVSLLPVLEMAPYNVSLFEGILFLLGGTNQNLSALCLDAIVKFVASKDLEIILWMEERIVQCLEAYQDNANKFASTVKSLKHLLTKSILEETYTLKTEFGPKTLKYIKKSLRKSGRKVSFLVLSAQIIPELVSFCRIESECIEIALKLLQAKYPIIRRTIAECMYEKLLEHQLSAISEESQDVVMDHLLEVEWDSDLCDLISELQELYKLFSLEIPDLSSLAQLKNTKKKKEFTFKSFVESGGN